MECWFCKLNHVNPMNNRCSSCDAPAKELLVKQVGELGADNEIMATLYGKKRLSEISKQPVQHYSPMVTTWGMYFIATDLREQSEVENKELKAEIKRLKEGVKQHVLSIDRFAALEARIVKLEKRRK